jgi:leucine-rich repeat transmembrane neuronal protein 1/2
MDDLIFSGAGSGCRGDDEDECMPPFENGSGDDLITPVYVPPTKSTATGTKAKPKENEKLCDDEDCLHGSGSGEVTDSYSTTSVTSKTEPKGGRSESLLTFSSSSESFLTQFFAL